MSSRTRLLAFVLFAAAMLFAIVREANAPVACPRLPCTQQKLPIEFVQMMDRQVLLQPRILRIVLLVDGDVGIGIFPEREEIFVGSERADAVALQSIGRKELQVRERLR
jgi:hypothetical protein